MDENKISDIEVSTDITVKPFNYITLRSNEITDMVNIRGNADIATLINNPLTKNETNMAPLQKHVGNKKLKPLTENNNNLRDVLEEMAEEMAPVVDANYSTSEQILYKTKPGLLYDVAFNVLEMMSPDRAKNLRTLDKHHGAPQGETGQTRRSPPFWRVCEKMTRNFLATLCFVSN